MSKLVRLLVSVVILGWLAWKLDWGHVAAMTAQAHVGGLAAALGLFLATQVVSALRWRMLSQPLGFRGSPARFVGDYYVGMYFSLLLPTSVGGDVVRVWALDRGSGRRTAALVSVLSDRACGLSVLVALGAVATLVCPVPLSTGIVLLAWTAIGSLAVALLAGPVGAVWLHRTQPALTWIPAAVRLRVRNLARLSSEAIDSYGQRPGLLLAAGLMSLVIQAANVAVVVVIALALGLSVPVGLLAVAVPLVTLLTLVPVSLNGMGVREAGMTLILAGQATPTEAVGLAFLWFVVTALSGLAGLGVYLTDGPARQAPATVEPELRRAA